MTTLSLDVSLDPSSELASANIEYFSQISKPLGNALLDLFSQISFSRTSAKYNSHSVVVSNKEYISDLSFLLANIIKNNQVFCIHN